MKKQPTGVRREQIAEAVLICLFKHGMDGLSVNVVAEEVGLVPSALYRHFKSKEEMLLAAVKLLRNRAVQNVRDIRREIADPVDQLGALLNRQILFVEKFRVIPSVLFTIKRDYTWLLKEFNRLHGGYLREVEKIIVAGQEIGRIKPGLPAKTLSIMHWGLMVQSTIRWHVSEGRFKLADHLTSAWMILKEAIEVPANE